MSGWLSKFSSLQTLNDKPILTCSFMKFGKLADISNVDFSLPPDPEETTLVLKKKGQANNPLNFYIGCTGWSMKEWVGKVYPPGTKTKEYLQHYSKQFNTIELNTTHYRTPDKATIQKWKTQSEDDFKFCPKLLQTISHSRDLGTGTGQLLEFCDAIQGLEEKLGCSFMQLPPYFSNDRLKILEAFLKKMPSHIPLALELRHQSWFEHKENQEALFSMLETYNTSTVITDVAGRRDVLHMRLTTPTAMVRFVGNGLHPSDYKRIDEWTDRILHWHKLGLKEVYFFTHEPDNILAPELAKYLADKLQSQKDVITRGPKFYDDGVGEQMSLF